MKLALPLGCPSSTLDVEEVHYGNPRVPPNATPPRNKALLGDDGGYPLIRPAISWGKRGIGGKEETLEDDRLGWLHG